MSKQSEAYCAMEYYTAIKRNGIFIHTTTWINLENIMLSERNQTEKTAYCMIKLTCNVHCRQMQKKKSIHGCRGLGEQTKE